MGVILLLHEVVERLLLRYTTPQHHQDMFLGKIIRHPAQVPAALGRGARIPTEPLQVRLNTRWVRRSSVAAAGNEESV